MSAIYRHTLHSLHICCSPIAPIAYIRALESGALRSSHCTLSNTTKNLTSGSYDNALLNQHDQAMGKGLLLACSLDLTGHWRMV